MHKKRYFIAVVLLMVLCIVWIFGQSLLPESSSDSESLRLLELVHRWFPMLTDVILRKLAHYFEFIVLGVILSFIPMKRLSTRILIGLLCALSDETIQMFALGRGSLIRDIWIDFVGLLSALLPIYLIKKYWTLRKEK